MAFEKTNNGGVIITGGNDTRLFQMMSQIKALELEVRTGLKFSGKRSLLSFLRDQYGLKSKTKKDAIVEMKKLFNEKSGKDFYDVD